MISDVCGGQRWKPKRAYVMFLPFLNLERSKPKIPSYVMRKKNWELVQEKVDGLVSVTL